MFANEMEFEVSVPRAGYEWITTPLRGEHYLREASPKTVSDTGSRICRPDIEQPALFLQFADLDPDSLDDIKDFANECGQIERMFWDAGKDFFPAGAEWMKHATWHHGWRRAITQLRHAIAIHGFLQGSSLFGEFTPHITWSDEHRRWSVKNHRNLTKDNVESWYRATFEFVSVDPLPKLHVVQADAISLMNMEKAQERLDRFKERHDHSPEVLAERFNWTPVNHPELTRESSGHLVLEAWLDAELSQHLNSEDLFTFRFGRHPRTQARCMMLIPNSLRSLLWLQFARAVTAEGDFAGDFRRCKTEGCGEWFCLTPKERARRVFCSDSCKVHHFRLRKETAVRLRSTGRTPTQIAKELDADVSTVKKWLKEAKDKRN